MVERKRREHCAVPVHFRLDQQRRAPYSIKWNYHALVALRGGVGSFCHQCSIRRYVRITFEQYFVRPHLRRKVLRHRRVLPRIVVVGSNVGFFVFVQVALVAIGDDDRLIVRGEVLNECRRGLDDVRIEPEHPRRGRADGCEEKRIAGSSHARASGSLILQLMPLPFVLTLDRRVKVLPFYRDACESLAFGARLRLCDRGLEGGGCGIALTTLGGDEAKGDEFVRIRELKEIFPISVVEASQRGQDEDGFAVRDGVGRSSEVVEMVVDYRRGCSLTVGLGYLFAEG